MDHSAARYALGRILHYPPVVKAPKVRLFALGRQFWDNGAPKEWNDFAMEGGLHKLPTRGVAL